MRTNSFTLFKNDSRDGLYYAHYYTKEGKRLNFSCMTHDEKEAMIYAEKRLTDIKNGVSSNKESKKGKTMSELFGKPDNIPENTYVLSQFMDDYISELRKINKKESTIEEYIRSFEVLLKSIANKSVLDFTKEDVINFIEHGSIKHAIRFGSVSPATVKKHIRHLKALWNYGLGDKSEFVKQNYWNKIKFPITEKQAL